MQLASIIIPIYKENISNNEKKSLIQCFRILFKYPIILAAPQNLNTSIYTKLAKLENKKLLIEYFDWKYFINTHTYNQLLLSPLFYKRFNDFKYILIYQLDAWVFRDELKYWCKQNFDYIGAPLIDMLEKNNMTFRQGGNGGFSLRKTEFFIKFLNYKGPILKPKEVFRLVFKNNNETIFFRFTSFLLRTLGFHNSIIYFKNRTYINEDMLISLNLRVSWVNKIISINNSWLKPKYPDYKKNIQFAFEKYPSYLYNLNNKKLPFGCHAWQKYEYNTFWYNFIN